MMQSTTAREKNTAEIFLGRLWTDEVWNDFMGRVYM